MQRRYRECPICHSEVWSRKGVGGVTIGCECVASEACSCTSSATRSYNRAIKRFGEPPQKPAPELSEQPKASCEDRTRHIADKIRECAAAFNREPCDTGWPEFQEYGSIAWGRNTLDIAKRDITRFGGFNAIRDTYFPPKATEQAETKLLVKEHARLNRQLGTTAVKDDLHFQQIEEWAASTFNARPAAPVAPSILKHALGEEIETELLFLCGDLHFGANVRGVETGGPDYGIVEESRSMAQCASRLLDWKPERRRKTGLTVAWLGDLIEGDIHDPRASAPLSEQINRAIHTTTGFVEVVAPEFARVTNHCVSGNHDRDVNRHPTPAAGAKWDSHATVIYFAAKSSTRHLDNVSWDIPQSAFCQYQICGHWYYQTHGDTDLRPGNPGQNIQVQRLDAETNKINAALGIDRRISVFIVGHAHSRAWAGMNYGSEVFVNGAMTPINSYARSIGVYRGNGSQMAIEVTPDYAAGKRCPIDLDESVYRDESLDRLIPPFQGL